MENIENINNINPMLVPLLRWRERLEFIGWF